MATGYGKRVMNSEICRAIETRSRIRFGYGDGLRVVEPFCHGVTGLGIEVLFGFQIAGYSRSRKPAGWRTFEETRMKGLRVTDEKFRPGQRDFHLETVPAISEVHCSV